MKRASYIALGIVLSLFTATTVVTSTVAWLKEGIDVGINGDNANVAGAIEASLFGGNSSQPNWGTEDNPYLIQNKNHLYNLAWMQYMGYFNTELDAAGKPTTTSSIQQKYFKLDVTDSLDMEGMVLPPIGTETFPFYSTFDGNNKTIENLVICNDDPRNDNSAFGINKPTPISIIPTFAHQPRTLGFFGAVGYIPTCDFAGATSNTTAATIQNVTLKDITVQNGTHLADGVDNGLLVGLAAGYVGECNMSGVKVAGTKTSLSINGTKAPITSGNPASPINDYSGLSDYALVGFSKNKGVAGLYSQKISQFFNSDSDTTPGTDPDWGGSIDFVEMFNTLSTIKSNAEYVDEHRIVQSKSSDGVLSDETIEIRNHDAFRNASDSNGTYCFADSNENNPDVIHLYGKQYMQKVFTDYSQSTNTFYIINSTNTSIYYGPNFSTLYLKSISSTTPDPVDARWYFTNGGVTLPTAEGQTISLGNVYAINDGTVYYLELASMNGTIRPRLSTVSNGFEWTISAHVVSNNVVYYLYSYLNSTRYYYLHVSSTSTSTTSTSTYHRMHLYSSIYVEQTTSDRLDDMNDTCFKHSTGYVTSGSHFEGQFHPTGSGDITISRYGREEVTNSTPKTITTSGLINNAANASLSEYEDTKAKFDEVISADSSRYYGLHFSNATIDKDDVAQTTSSLSMPRHSIEFNVERKGYIKVFAGTYYGTNFDSATKNNSFFSLHKINRNASNVITSIEEIKYIYGKTGAPYIYSDLSTAPSGYSLVFNTEWLTNPGTNFVEKAIYYFEIPVNAGEYCMGAIPGKYGAYLMYADIGSSGASVEADLITAYAVTTIKEGNNYPIGVDFLTSDLQGTSGGETFGVVISSSSSGTISFGCSASSASISYSSSFATTYAFKVKAASTSGSQSPPGEPTSSIFEAFRIIYSSIETTDGHEWTIQIRESLNSSFEVTSSTYLLIEKDTHTGTSNQTQSDLPSLFVSTLSSIEDKVSLDAVILTRLSGTVEFVATPTYSGDDFTVVNISVSLSNISIEASNKDAGHTIYVNGVLMDTDPKTYQ